MSKGNTQDVLAAMLSVVWILFMVWSFLFLAMYEVAR